MQTGVNNIIFRKKKCNKKLYKQQIKNCWLEHKDLNSLLVTKIIAINDMKVVMSNKMKNKGVKKN